MRYLFGLMFVLALAVMGCETTGADGSGGTGGDGGTGGGMAACVDFVCPCTEAGIRAAIEQGGGPFTFDCVGPTTVVAEEVIDIVNGVVLDGEGNLTVDGSESGTVFAVSEGVTAELRGFTVTRGGESFPGGLGAPGYDHGCVKNSGMLTLTDTSISKNIVGIENEGTMTLTNSTVSGSEVTWGIMSRGTMMLTNSTVSGNAGDGGGAITIFDGTLTLLHSTISDSVYVQTPPPGKTPTIASTATVIDGACGTDEGIPVNWTSNGYNIESPGNTCGFDEATDQVVPDAMLGPLQDNGDPTETHALLPGSPAINQIPEAECVDADGEPLTTDQRGEPRPETGGTECDVGAFELEETTATVTGTVTFAGSGAPVDGAGVSVFGASVSTVTDAQGQFTLDVPVGSVFFQISKEGTWGQVELETVPTAGDVTFELVEDSLVAEVEQSLVIEFSETQGVVDVIFNSPSGLGGETTTLSVPYDSSLTFDAAEQPVLSDGLIPGGGEDLVFVGVDLTEELIVSPMGVDGVNNCDLETPGTVYPVLAKSFTRVRQVRCTRVQ